MTDGTCWFWLLERAASGAHSASVNSVRWQATVVGL